ncbi:MAG: manganese efflux pump MntP family protein [Bacillota bacterium]|jgi:putative Mn2+ efflux pump MntP
MKCRLRLSRRGMILIILILFIVLINRLLHWSGTLATLSGTVPRQLLPLLLMAAALGADAMSLCVGIGLRGVSWREVLRVSLVIGFFHVGMPLLGALGGHFFGMLAGGIARVLGAGLVALIGVRMIRECLGGKENPCSQWTLTGFPLLALATGVSIDALSVGFGLGAFGYNIFATALTFGVFSAAMSALGLVFGCRMGKLVGERGELIGGFVLLVLAIHMLFEG